MKKLLLTTMMASTLALTGCNCNKSVDANTKGGSDDIANTNTGSDATNDTGKVAAAAALAVGAFSWDGISKSTADLGGFPHFNLPEGFKLSSADGDNPFSKLIDGAKDGISFYDGKGIATAKGKLAVLDIETNGDKFDQADFDAKITEQMKALGATEITSEMHSDEVLAQLAAQDGLHVKDYLNCDHKDSKLRQFVVNHENGQVLYQVKSDGTHGQVAVLELDGFKAADKATDSANAASDETGAEHKHEHEHDGEEKHEHDHKHEDGQHDKDASTHSAEDHKHEHATDTADDKAAEPTKTEPADGTKTETEDKPAAEDIADKTEANEEEKTSEANDDKSAAEITEEKPVEPVKAETAEEPKTAAAMEDQLEEVGKITVRINFDSGKSSINENKMGEVDTIFKLLTDNAELKLSIEGHTDSSGNAESNKKLSIARANTVMKALIAKGIAADRLKATGFGSEKPVAANDTAENRTLNRRVELVQF